MLNVFMGIVAPLAAGLVMGSVYFGGLWLTMRSLPRSSHPAMLVITSYFGRMAFAFAVILLVAQSGDWKRLLACMAGFLAIKLATILRFGPHGRSLKSGLEGGMRITREAEDGNQS